MRHDVTFATTLSHFGHSLTLCDLVPLGFLFVLGHLAPAQYRISFHLFLSFVSSALDRVLRLAMRLETSFFSFFFLLRGARTHHDAFPNILYVTSYFQSGI
jgi:hypothetical protein